MRNKISMSLSSKKLGTARPALLTAVCALALFAPTHGMAQQSEKWAPPEKIEAEAGPSEPSADNEQIEDSAANAAEAVEAETAEYEAPAEENAAEEAAVEEIHQEIENKDVETAAPETPQTAEQKTVAPPDQEFIGFSPPDDPRSLGNDVFRGSTRSTLTGLLKSLPSDVTNPVVYKTANRLLLTAGRTSDIINDANPIAGEDLLTLRLEKMLERGLYVEAASLYTSLKTEPYHERLAAAGLTALIMTGRKSLACLDIKTFFADQAKIQSWKELSTYCNYVMSAASGSETEQTEETATKYADIPVLSRIASTPEYTENYAPAIFGNLSQFERAVMIGENRITVDLQTLHRDLAQGQIPPADIQALLQLTSLDLDTRLLLIVEGIRSASVSNATLISLFKSTTITDKDSTPAANIIRIYKRIRAKEPGDDPLEQMRTALNISANFGSEAMIPLLPTLESIEPKEFTPAEYSAALAAFIAADRDLPPMWQDSITVRRQIPETIEPKALRNTLLVQIYLLTTAQERTKEQKTALRELLADLGQNSLTPLIDIIENVDKDTAAHNNGPKVYENGFDTPQNKGYTVPSENPRKRLKIAVSANAVGETVLLSNLVFRRASAEPLSPEALIEVTDSFEKIGLYDQAKALTAEAVFAAVK